MLHRALEEDSSGECIDVAGLAYGAVLVVGVVELVEGGATEVHRADGVAYEGVYACVKRFGIAGALSEMKVLGCEDSLGCGVVGIHAFPSAWEGAAVEDDEQSEVVGIGENVLIELHHGLFVASEEIDLDAPYAVVVHPFHLLAADACVVHLADGCLWCVVPCAVAVVPEEEAHALGASVAGEFGDAVITDLSVPESVDEHALVRSRYSVSARRSCSCCPFR